MIDAMLSFAQKKIKDKAEEKAFEKLKNRTIDKFSEAGNKILTAPERMFDGEPLAEDFIVQPIQHHPLVQSQAQFMPLNQMQGMPMQGMPTQQANPYGSAMQNMGLMELLEQAARMR